jgi:uncharacterized membrane protein
MSLKRVTLLVIIGIVCSFFIRTVGTFLPFIFKNITIVWMGMGIHLFAGLTVVIFFLMFYNRFIQAGQRALQKACILAIIGSLGALFLHIKGLSLVLEKDIFPLFLMQHHIDAILPLVSSLTILFFFIIFRKEMGREVRVRLDKATRLAIMGSSIIALLHAIILINYLHSGEFRWLAHFSRKAAIGFTPILAFAVISVLYFFLSFYRFVEVSAEKSKKDSV